MKNKISEMFNEIQKSIGEENYSTITREELAKKLNVSKRTINRYMNSLIDRGYIIRIDLTHEKPYGQRRIYLRNKN